MKKSHRKDKTSLVEQRVQQCVVNETDSRFNECVRICGLSRDLYNEALLTVRNHYKEHRSYFDNFKVTNLFTKTNNKVFRNFGKVKPAKQTLSLLNDNFTSFFALLKKKREGKYNKPVRPPRLRGQHQLMPAIYDREAINGLVGKKEFLTLSGTSIKIKCTINPEKIKLIRVIPKGNHFIIETVYEKLLKPLLPDNGNVAGLDLGKQNFCTIAPNNAKPLIISGRSLVSTLEYYNYKIGQEKKKLNKNVKTNKEIKRLYKEKNLKVNNFLHQASRQVIDYLVNNQVNSFAIGKNCGWKQNLNLGRKTNRSFGHLPHARFIELVLYKAKELGLCGVTVQESYTSKCSFLDKEAIQKQGQYLGKRKGRLFRASNGTVINADVNGALNIARKIFGDFNYDPIMVRRSPRIVKQCNFSNLKSCTATYSGWSASTPSKA